MNLEGYFLNKARNMISSQTGVIKKIVKLPLQNGDPKLIAYGIMPSDTLALGANKFSGKSSGCGYTWDQAILSTLGEVAERYAPVFYDKNETLKASFDGLPTNRKKIHPSEYALYHETQYAIYEKKGLPIKPFQENTELHWSKCIDLTDGQEAYIPSVFVYMPFNEDDCLITLNTSTGLAAHTNIHKAILTALYECIERDAFVISWTHQLNLPKIKITAEIRNHLQTHFSKDVECHLIDITLDIPTPSVFGFCIGESDFGKFVVVGSSTRSAYSQAVKKVILECSQAISYLRHTLSKNVNWKKNREELINFEDHSLYYNIHKSEQTAFDFWRNKKEEKEIDFNESPKENDIDEIRNILTILKNKNYNALLKDITTVDIHQCGFYAIKVYIPQLIQIAGLYSFYFYGGKRLINSPVSLGYKVKDISGFNPYPHPFP